MKTGWRKKIEINPDIMGGKPVIKGTRVPVEVIVGGLAGGMAFEEVCKEYRITLEDIKAVKTCPKIHQFAEADRRH